MDAGSSDVATAAEAINATLVGIGFGTASTAAQIEALASATDSVADTDGDGDEDTPLAYRWSSSASALGDLIVDAAAAAVAVRTPEPAPFTFSEVQPIITDDVGGFVTHVTPGSWTELDPGDETSVHLRMTLDLEGTVPASSVTTVYGLTLILLGDGGPALGRLPIEIRVPQTPDE